MTWAGTLLHIHSRPLGLCRDGGTRRGAADPRPGHRGRPLPPRHRTYSQKPDIREVTLIEMSAGALAQGEPKIPGLKAVLDPADHRRNLTTRGVPPANLVGRRFRVGETVLRGGG